MGASYPRSLENTDIDCRLSKNAYDDPNFNDKHYLLVLGYIRNYCHREFPQDLIGLCLSMYFMYIDTWHYQQDFQVLTKYNTIESMLVGRQWRLVLGNLLVKRGMIVEWKIKIVTKSEQYTPQIIVGIVDAENVPLQFNLQNRNHGYGYSSISGRFIDKHGVYEFGCNYTRGDVVRMVLDLTGIGGVKMGTLSYYVNEVAQGENNGIAVNSVHLDRTYKMMMSCFTPETVQLLL